MLDGGCEVDGALFSASAEDKFLLNYFSFAQIYTTKAQSTNHKAKKQNSQPQIEKEKLNSKTTYPLQSSIESRKSW